MNLLTASNIGKVYSGAISFEALANIDLSVAQGEFVGIMGPSGSGKTTLLNMVSTIDRPTSGEIRIAGENPFQLSYDQLALFRRRELGFVFQAYNLLHKLTVKENIMMPLVLDAQPIADMNRRVEEIAEKLGITSILGKRTYEISGGQAQRTAIARALIHRPKVLLADEPTGNLDSRAAKGVMEILEKRNKEDGTTMLLVTHDPAAASHCDRVVFIKDGRLYNEIHCGDSRAAFYQKIIDLLSVMGGSENEFSPIRYS